MNRFLIVEDNKLMAEILAQIIRKCTTPKDIIKVSSLAAAQKILIDSNSWIDAVFLDLNIDKPLDGLELLSFIKKNLPNMPVSIITSESDADVVKQVLSHQPQDYLVKPLSVKQVQRSLDKFRTKASSAAGGSA
ncbi:response regulator [Photobacterium sp. SDRW27]|uniref:response regulator n=1 Tax=Photobacterium obscurum TaxID=2829490 RepID=UPI002243D346|nr:response regulator [Photobacterium obscurum]MCW8328702.1 response regulator [Photobacterium obscurum]